ncbi:MAG: glutaredoxin family protein [Anaerolineae bacterium]|nr:glutaredoxin family protein [Anaerolineae bacterium]
MTRELVMYSRTVGCPFITVAKRVLDDYALPYREVFIDKDMEARERVLEWTGFLSVPTLVVAEAGSVLPYEAPAYLAPGASPRGINRGAMITEANIEQLSAWLVQHGFIENVVTG